MDPIGFGLENYDAAGAWRERDGKFPIDSAAPKELKQTLKSQADKRRAGQIGLSTAP